MLILTRKLGEAIVIGGQVVVRVVRVEKDWVKLAIDGPRDTTVHRQEVQEKINREKSGG